MNGQKIHPTAIVDPNAELGEGVEVGPYACIEAGVTVGDRTRIGPMVQIQATTEIGPDNVIGAFSTIGFPPQYLGFDGSPTLCVIGARNVLREYFSMHRSIYKDGATVLGDDGFMMAASHIAHDCIVGDRVTMANAVLLAGHVEVGDRVFISGNAAVHQFCRIGTLAMVGGLTRITNDVPPYTITDGRPAWVRGLNVVGLRRAELGSAVRRELKLLYADIYGGPKTVSERVEELLAQDPAPHARTVLEFYRASKRGITRAVFGRGVTD